MVQGVGLINKCITSPCINRKNLNYAQVPLEPDVEVLLAGFVPEAVLRLWPCRGLTNSNENIAL